jgi:hydroxymethylbilane synthase
VPLDAFISNRHDSLDALPAGAVVGTSSLRRECQLRHAHPRLAFAPLRGNVNTRLAKLDAGDYEAIILAAAGLRRLGLAERIRASLPQSLAIPAIGQGILAIEHLAARADLAACLAPLERSEVAAAAQAERALGLVVEGSCEVPVAAHARVEGGQIRMEAFLGLPDGSRMVRDSLTGTAPQACEVGRKLGEQLLAAGGRDILRELARLRA